MLSEDVKLYMYLFTSKRYYALNDRTINLLMKGGIDMSAITSETAEVITGSDKEVVDLINEEINNCGNNDEGKSTIWGEPCNGEWEADKVVNYINNNLKIENPFSKDTTVKTDADPRIKAEGKAGQSVEMGVIFVMSSNFLPDPGSEWVVGTCFKSPCVAAGNNELTSIYR